MAVYSKVIALRPFSSGNNVYCCECNYGPHAEGRYTHCISCNHELCGKCTVTEENLGSAFNPAHGSSDSPFDPAKNVHSASIALVSFPSTSTPSLLDRALPYIRQSYGAAPTDGPENFVWYCSECGDGPMGCSIHPSCVGCGHPRCSDCNVETTK